jgi:lipopolysaccharide exporter
MATNPPKAGFTRNVIKLVSGATTAQLITLLTAPVISRLFLPSSFGTLSVFISLVSILSIIVCLRYEFAIMLPEDDREAIHVMALSLGIAFIFTLVVSGILYLIRSTLIRWLNAPDLAPFLWLVPLAIFIQGLFQAFNYWNSRTRHFGQLSIARVAASLTTSAIPVTLGLLHKTTTAGLIGAWVAGTVVLTALLGWNVWRQSFARLYTELNFNKLLANLVRYRKFPLVDAWGSFINNLSWQMPSLILSAFFSQTIVGYYSQANRMILLPLTLIGNAIAQVFFQRTSELRSHPEKLTATVEAVFRVLVFLGFLPALILTLVGKELFTVILGISWSEAGLYAQILGFWLFFMMISSPLSTLFLVLERQELGLIVNLVILVTRLAALLSGSLLHNIYLTLWIWSGTGVLVYGLMALWILKLANVSFNRVIGPIWNYILTAIPVGLVIGLVKVIFPGLDWIILMTTGGMALLYYTFTLKMDRTVSAYLVNLLPSAWRERVTGWLAPKS